MKVLIADPDWRFAQRTSQLLESLAHLVVCQGQIERAIDRARHWKPDLVLLDAELANAGLMDALHAIRPRPAILLTGWMDRYDLAWRAWQTGGDELLIKPVFKSADILQAIVIARENAAIGIRRTYTAASA